MRDVNYNMKKRADKEKKEKKNSFKIYMKLKRAGKTTQSAKQKGR